MAGEYLSTDPNAGLPAGGGGYLSTDPNAGVRMGPKDVPDSVGAPDSSSNVGKTGVWDVVKGIPEAAIATGQGALAGLAGRATALLPGVDPATGVKVQQAMSPNVSARAQPTMDLIENLTDSSKIAGLGPMAMPGGPATRLAKPAVRQAGRTVEADAMKRIPGKIADLVTPTPSREIEALAKKAEDMGIELRPDMLGNNRIAKFMGEALEQVPLSGSKAEQRQMAFNGALTKIIGSDEKVTRLTPDVFDRAITASGKKIGQISRETPITVDSDLRAQFQNRVLEASKFETADVAKIVSNYVQEMDGLTVNNVMPGEAFRKLNSKIGNQIRSTNNGDLKNALYELQEIMHGALEKNISSPARLAELKDARYKYAMAKIIEPLVAKTTSGDISPSGLMHAVTSDKAKKAMMARGKGGEIGDLARIGQAFLKEPPSSGTGERLGAYSLLSGHGLALAPLIPAANVYNRLGPKLTKRAVNVRDVDPQVAQPWNIGQP